MLTSERPVAVVSGASSGIGAAAAGQLSVGGWHVVAGARRVERLEKLAAELGATVTALPLDVTDDASVERFAQQIPRCRLVVHCAGGAIGTTPIARADLAEWQKMYDTNVLGVLRLTKALLPELIDSGDGHVIVIGSVAAFEPYAGGSGYNSAKAAVTALCDVLRIESLGQPLRVSEIDPGMVETEFSVVRYGGDRDKAAAVYAGMTPLSAQDVAEAVAWVAGRPSHVDIDRVVMRPRDQARVHLVHRDSD